MKIIVIWIDVILICLLLFIFTTVKLWDLENFTNKVCYKGHSYPVWDVDIG